MKTHSSFLWVWPVLLSSYLVEASGNWFVRKRPSTKSTAFFRPNHADISRLTYKRSPGEEMPLACRFTDLSLFENDGRLEITLTLDYHSHLYQEHKKLHLVSNPFTQNEGPVESPIDTTFPIDGNNEIAVKAYSGLRRVTVFTKRGRGPAGQRKVEKFTGEYKEELLAISLVGSKRSGFTLNCISVIAKKD